MQTQVKAQHLSIMVFLISWIAFAAVYMVLKSYVPAEGFARIFLSVVLLISNVIVFIYAFKLWEKSQAKSKRIFGFFALSLFCILVHNAIYQSIFNILHLNHMIFSTFATSWYQIPYFGFLIFQLLAWIYLLPQITSATKKKRDLILYIPFVIIVIFMLWLFFVVIKLEILRYHLSAFGLFSVVYAVLGFASFIMAMLCLATAKHKGILYLALGFLINKTGGLLMFFGSFTQKLGTGSILETLWVLGFVLMIYGFMSFKKSKTYNNSPKTWIYPINSIRTQIAFWTFASFVISSAVFLSVHYLIAPSSFLKNTGEIRSLFPILIAYSVITVMLSKFFAEKICSPLRKMESLINLFMQSKKPDKPLKEKYYNVLEFNNIEYFLRQSFKTLEEKHAAEKYIAKMAAQVAHDIGSPLVAMQLALKEIKGTDSKTKNTIHNIAGRIYDIANYLLTEYKNPKIDKASELSTEFMPDLIDCILFEKRLLQENKKIEFHTNIADDACQTFIKTNKAEFQCALSNLINNSMEAIDDKGEITINLKSENAKVVIEVIDTGKGIPQEIINKITQEKFTYGKEKGTGLGLSYAIEKIKAWGGDYRIESKIDNGSKITIKLPKDNHPAWFQKQISMPVSGKIIVLDKGEAIYSELSKRFDNVIHCQAMQEFEDYTLRLSNDYYYLIGMDIPGICPEQLIKNLDLQQQAVLVTDKYNDQIFMGICQSYGIKVIPRSYVGRIPVAIL